MRAFCRSALGHLILPLMLAALAGCKGGILWLQGNDICQGSYCSQTCATNTDCPATAFCFNGRCSQNSGGSNGISGGTGGTAGTGGTGLTTGGNSAGTGGTGNTNGTGGLPPNTTGGNTGGNTAGDPNCTTPNVCGNCLPVTNCPNPNVVLPAPDPNTGVYKDPNGNITLSSSTDVTSDYAWASNTNEGTVSRIDTLLGVESGRYASVLRISGNPNVADYDTGCPFPSRTTTDANGNCYVANRANRDDGQGPTTVCNSSVLYYSMGSVTKIANYDAQQCSKALNPGLFGCKCADRNNDGMITTSTDVDGDGHIFYPSCTGSCQVGCVSAADCAANSPSAPYCIANACSVTAGCVGACNTSCGSDADCTNASAKYCYLGRCSTKPREFFGYADECLLWTSVVPRPAESTAGQSGSKPRGMALDANGFVWVGDFTNEVVYKFDQNGNIVAPPTGASTSSTNGINVGINVYGQVIDSTGELWMTQPNGSLVALNTRTGAIDIPIQAGIRAPLGTYGITIDRSNQVWVPAFNLQTTPKMQRFNRTAQTWSQFPASDTGFNYLGSSWQGRGVTASATGIVWGIFNNTSGYSPDPNVYVGTWLIGYDDQTGDIMVRARMDQDPSGAHMPCSGSVGVGIGAEGKIWLVSRDNDTICAYDPGTGDISAIPIGWVPYTYSDFTGNIQRTFTRKQAYYTLVEHGCDTGYTIGEWLSATWVAQLPGQSQIQIQYRAATTTYNLGAANFSPPITLSASSGNTGTFTLNIPRDNYIEFQFSLIADETGNFPVLQSFQTTRTCVSTGGG